MKSATRIKFFFKRNKIFILLTFLFAYYFYLRPSTTTSDEDFESTSDHSASAKKSSKYSPIFSGFDAPAFKNGRKSTAPKANNRVGARKLVTSLNNSISMPPLSGTDITSLPIPNKIWTFWHKPNLPQFLLDCVAGWERNNPYHSVVIITPENLQGYIHTRPPHIFEIMDPVDQSAWVRLAILAQDGGIWIDPTMIVTRSLGFIHEKQQALRSEGLMFFMDHFVIEPAYPFFEKYMIAAVPGAKFVQMWFKEWNFVITDFNGGDEYFTHLQKTYGRTTFRKLIQACDTPSDFRQEIALLKVLRIDGLPYPPGLSAIKHSYGPLASLDSKDWNNWEFVGSLFLPIGETELIVEDHVPHLIYLTPYQIQIIDWMGFLNTRVYHEMNHQSFFCLHLQNDPIECGGKRSFSDEACDDPSHIIK